MNFPFPRDCGLFLFFYFLIHKFSNFASQPELILGFILFHKFSNFTYAGVMGCGAAEATGLDFVCFVVINPCVL